MHFLKNYIFLSAKNIIKMSRTTRLRKGLNIRLKGKAEKIFIKTGRAETYAIKPPDFQGLTPKLLVKVEDEVKVGTPLFFDKYNPAIQFTSPVSGKILAIVRGERRRIMEVVIKADTEDEFIEFGSADPDQLSREDIIDKLLKSGLWAYIRQRPYGIIANPEDNPKSIFISAYNSAPLASDRDFTVTGEEVSFQVGINVLTKLTTGKIYLNINGKYPPSPVYSKAKNVEINKFIGPHPAGNIGVQIHHIDPINKGDIVWYLYPQDVISIGRLFQKGIFDASRIVALAGSEVLKPRYYKTTIGASIKEIVKENVKNGNLRYISGNVLTGSKIFANGYIGFYDTEITVIPEGDQYEFFGWLLPGLKKFSVSHTFLSWLQPGREYTFNTNIHGGHRAFVMTGEYEKVVPMDIYPVQLLKAILVEDIDKMEQLGIYEVIEEDFALCEYVCTSKIDVQEILRKGLDLIRKEMS